MELRMAIRDAINILKRGGVVIAPTDSVYGLFGDALNESTARNIRKIKGRDANKPFQIAILKEQAWKYGTLNQSALKVMNKYWPGDVNIIVQKTPAVPSYISENTVCLTCHRNRIIDAIIRGVGRPLVSTSVNLSGMPPATRVEDIDGEVAGKVDLIMDGGETKNKMPNTIVDVTSEPARIVREGPVGKTELEKIISIA